MDCKLYSTKIKSYDPEIMLFIKGIKGKDGIFEKWSKIKKKTYVGKNQNQNNVRVLTPMDNKS